MSQHSKGPVGINPTPKKSKIIVHYLVIIDRMVTLEDLKSHFCWQRLIFIFSTPSYLTNLPLTFYTETISIWEQRDLTPSVLHQFLAFLVLQPSVHTVRSLGYIHHPLAKLSKVDIQLFRYMAEGKHTEEISQKLNLSKSTIERHKRHWKERLGVEALTDCGLIRLLHNHGVIALNDDPKKDLD